MGDMGDAWKEIKDKQQQNRNKNEDWGRQVIYFLSAELGFKVTEIAHYQYRLTHPVTKRSVDVFPRTNKVTWTGSNKYFQVQDLEKWIIDNFKTDNK